MTTSSPAAAQQGWQSAPVATGAIWNANPPKLGFRAYLTCFKGNV